MAPLLIDHRLRRRALAEAAWRVILRDGIARVSIRTVAAEAGFSAGSLRHVVPRQDDLLAAALELVIEKARARVARLPATLGDRARARAIARELLPLDEERRAEFEVHLSLITLAFAHDALREVRDAANDGMLDACRYIVSLLRDAHGTQGTAPQGTAPQPPPPDDADERDARRLHALLDGLAAHLVQAPGLLSADDATAILDGQLDDLEAADTGRRIEQP